MEKKHHYRAVYKSDHLGIADLEDFIEAKRKLIFTISHVNQEMNVTVAGKKGDHNIAYFTDPSIKPWVLNATNAKIIKAFAGGDPFVESWRNITVELYIDSTVKMKGEVVGGIRVSPVQPRPKPEFTAVNFLKAKQQKATIAQIEAVYTIADEMKEQYNNYVIPQEDATA